MVLEAEVDLAYPRHRDDPALLAARREILAALAHSQGV